MSYNHLKVSISEQLNVLPPNVFSSLYFLSCNSGIITCPKHPRRHLSHFLPLTTPHPINFILKLFNFYIFPNSHPYFSQLKASVCLLPLVNAKIHSILLFTLPFVFLFSQTLPVECYTVFQTLIFVSLVKTCIVFFILQALLYVESDEGVKTKQNKKTLKCSIHNCRIFQVLEMMVLGLQFQLLVFLLSVSILIYGTH